MSQAYKIIRDPVHGYIKIPYILCQKFIDTSIFQRLRSIEQTSMRCLFPGGRHDRFIHSLGVYHLATRLYDGLLFNTQGHDEIAHIINDVKMRRTFEVAALMHDCGHAPFSHTTEFLYNKYGTGGSHNNTYNALMNIVDPAASAEFDFNGIKPKKPAHHEAMSAYVLQKFYKKELEDLEIDPTLASRMITGVVHLYPLTIKEKIENILIRLINGDAIDVDKLDYVVRDTWASGVKNSAIDIGRLLDAAVIEEKGNDPCFSYRSSALSVIQTVIDARNYLYEWIYGHHTVIYYAELLKRLCLLLENEIKLPSTAADLFLSEMFSTRIFDASGNCSSTSDILPVYLLNDGDVMAILKKYLRKHPFYQAIEAHVPAHFPIWKTEAEFKAYVHADKRTSFSAETCVNLFKEKYGLSDENCFFCNGMSSKLYDIEPKAVKICMPDGNVFHFTDLANVTSHPSISNSRANPFSYIFVDNSFKTKRNDLLNLINQYEW